MDFPVPAGETRMRMTISGQPGSCGKSGGGELNLKEKNFQGHGVSVHRRNQVTGGNPDCPGGEYLPGWHTWKGRAWARHGTGPSYWLEQEDGTVHGGA